MREEWRDIAGYEGYYQVSNQGRVRSLDRAVKRGKSTLTVRGRILKPSIGSHYLQVTLSKGNKLKPSRIHRLVAAAFVSNPNGFNVVDHINCDKLDNRAENLRWCEQSDNISFANSNGLIKFHPKTKKGAASYHEKRCKPIVRDDGKVYEHCADAAKDLGVTYSAVMHVLRGLAKTCKGHSFSYYSA